MQVDHAISTCAHRVHLAAEPNGTAAVCLLNCIQKIVSLKARFRRCDRSVVRITPAAQRIRVCSDSCVCVDEWANALLANNSFAHGATTKILRLLIFVELVAAMRALKVSVPIRENVIAIDFLDDLLVELSSYLHFKST